MGKLLDIGLSIRDGFSRLLSHGLSETDYEPDVCGSISEFEIFIWRVYRWKRDYGYGLLDNVYSIRHMNWQLEKTGVIRGDCDDLATYSCYMLGRMGYRVWRVNMPSFLHVICVFSDGVGYDVVSNDNLFLCRAKSLDSAVRAWVADHGVISYKAEEMDFIAFENGDERG